VAIDIVSRAALESKSVEDPDWDFEDQLKDEGFSESEIDELLAIGFFSIMMNKLTDTYDVPWESPFPPESDCDTIAGRPRLVVLWFPRGGDQYPSTV
jgi:hypothetical protein